MNAEQSWTFVDRTNWRSQVGPWNGEPDKLQWVDEATNLDCLIHRGPSGALCGYVGLPPEHRLHGKDYESVDAEVHGGLTFASACDEHPRADGGGICHIPLPGRPANVWWLGFDCAHSGDVCPSYYEPGMRMHETYKSLAYVCIQCARLAAQLAGLPEGAES